MFKWIGAQFEWFKGFFQESEGGKGSIKSLATFLIVITFLASYWKVSMINEAMEDIPEIWALLLFSLLGLKSYFDYKMKNPATNGDSFKDKVVDALSSSKEKDKE